MKLPLSDKLERTQHLYDSEVASPRMWNKMSQKQYLSMRKYTWQIRIRLLGLNIRIYNIS